MDHRTSQTASAVIGHPAPSLLHRQPNLGRDKMLRVYVDGIDKGEVFKRAGRWYWRRGPVAVDPFPRGLTKAQAFAAIAEWARKCCNGRIAEIKPRND